MPSRFVVHQHRAGRSHFDIRIVEDNALRSWSLLREPPRRKGEKRLAIERESFPVDAISNRVFEEEAFGRGSVYGWDEGTAEFEVITEKRVVVRFAGKKLTGKYEFRRMRWYPGNRWMLGKVSE